VFLVGTPGPTSLIGFPGIFPSLLVGVMPFFLFPLTPRLFPSGYFGITAILRVPFGVFPFKGTFAYSAANSPLLFSFTAGR
jgi:hypothetical protein